MWERAWTYEPLFGRMPITFLVAPETWRPLKVALIKDWVSWGNHLKRRSNLATIMGLIRVIRDTFLDFGRNTSIAGLNNAAKAKSIIRSLIWLSLFTVGLYYTLMGIISVINDYHNYPVVTKTQLQQEKLVNFPAISICNHNRSAKYWLRSIFDSHHVQETLGILFSRKPPFRVHCTNLLTQYYDKKEAIDNGTTNDQELNATVFILDALFDKTGCRVQVCDQVIDSLSFNRSQEGNFSKSDWSLVKLAQITWVLVTSLKLE